MGMLATFSVGTTLTTEDRLAHDHRGSLPWLTVAWVMVAFVLYLSVVHQKPPFRVDCMLPGDEISPNLCLVGSKLVAKFVPPLEMACLEHFLQRCNFMTIKNNRHRRPHPFSYLVTMVWLLFGTAAATSLAAEVSTEDSTALEAQIALDLANFSPGAIDGIWGTNSRGALRAYQSAHGLETSGELDAETRDSLQLDRDLLIDHTLTAQDLEGPFIDEVPESPMDQAALEHLAYTSPSEAIAEQFHLDEDTLASLNPEIELTTGATIRVPNVHASPGQAGGSSGASDAGGGDADGNKADGDVAIMPREPVGEIQIVVSKSTSSLVVRDSEERVVFYAPVTAGSQQEPLPLGEWTVEAISVDPQYHYDPELIAGADPNDREVSLPPGPNNPVGVVWIGINKEHYGLHGTPEPSEIGYTESSGCVRLTNWDAMELAHMVSSGTRVTFQE